MGEDPQAIRLTSLGGPHGQSPLQAHIHPPPIHHDFLVHMCHHVAKRIAQHGPPWCYALWAFELLWGHLINQKQSTRQAAISIMLNSHAQALSLAVFSMLGQDLGQVCASFGS